MPLKFSQGIKELYWNEFEQKIDQQAKTEVTHVEVVLNLFKWIDIWD